MRCEQVSGLLPGIMDGLDQPGDEVVAHIETCLRCQAELAQYRKLLKVLHQLRSQSIEPPPGLLVEILAQLSDAAERGAMRSALAGRRLAYLAGLAVAAGAAGAAGAAVILATRGRGGKLPLAS
jgi:anti-sigma factor RsiW